MGDEKQDALLSQVGLCADCRHSRQLENSKGHRFYRCDKAKSDPRFAPYPRLPVRVCPGHNPR